MRKSRFTEAQIIGMIKDSEAFCRSTANELVEHHVDGKTYAFTIRHAG